MFLQFTLLVFPAKPALVKTGITFYLIFCPECLLPHSLPVNLLHTCRGPKSIAPALLPLSSTFPQHWQLSSTFNTAAQIISFKKKKTREVLFLSVTAFFLLLTPWPSPMEHLHLLHLFLTTHSLSNPLKNGSYSHYHI